MDARPFSRGEGHRDLGLTGVGGWSQTSRAPGGDVAVERQDQLFLTPDGTLWVRSDPSPDVVDDDIRWHRAPSAMFGQLAQEGRLFGSRPAAVAAVAEPDAVDRGAVGAARTRGGLGSRRRCSVVRTARGGPA